MAKRDFIACRICAEPVRAQAKICRFCGAVLDAEGLARLASPPAPDPAPAPSDRQRRHIEEFLAAQTDENRAATVLFVDLTGYTALSRKISAENLKTTFLDAFYSLCSQAVEFYNGFIVKFMGDAALAVFGGPRAYERDVESAVRAALLIRERVGALPYQDGQPLQIHAGIATGEILASSTRKGGQTHFDIFGDSVNLASRILSGAPAGAILICPTTQELVAGIFELKPNDPQRYKGIAGQVVTWEVTGEKREDVSRRDFSIPFVGRSSELRQMEEAWNKFLTAGPKPKRERAGQPAAAQFHGLVLTGEAGIGKSRLAREFLRRLAQEGPSAGRPAVLSYEANPYDPQVPYCVWRALLGKLADPGAPTQAALTREAFRRFTVSLKMKGDPFLGLRAMLGFKDALAGVQFMGVEFLRRQIIAELRLLLERIAVKTPVILVLDDLQWADHASLEVLDALFAPPGPAGVFVLVSCRSEARLPTRIKKNWSPIRLQALPEEDRREVLHGLAPAGELAPRLIDLLALHSEGNPLYLLELQRHVRRQLAEIPQIARRADFEETVAHYIPLTLKNIIQSRIDQLEQKRKTVLQCGAVIGKRFMYRLIGLIEMVREGLLEHLYALTGLEFLESSPIPPDIEFAFRHHLVRETAYQTLLQRQRQQLHHLIAERMEGAYRNKLEDYYPILAFHFDKGNQRPQAIHYYRLAGDRAKTQAAASDAIGFYDKAIEYLLAGEPAAEAQWRAALLLVEKSRLLRNTGKCPQSLEALGKARRLPAAAARQAIFAIETGLTHVQTANYAAARRVFKTAEQLLARQKDPALKAMLHNGLGICAYGQCQFNEARRQYQQTLRLAEQSGTLSLSHDARNNLALLDWKAGRLQEALAGFRLTLRLARKTANRFAMALTLMNLGIVEENLGRFAQAARQYRSALELAEQIQFIQIQGAALCNLGNLFLVREEWIQAQDHSARALDLARSIEDHRSAAIALENLALAQMGLLQDDACRASLLEARSIARRIKDHERLFSLDLVEIEWLIDRGGAGPALKRLEAAERNLQAHELTAELPRLLRLRTHALLAAGRAKEASSVIRQAEEACARQGNKAELIRLRAILTRKKIAD